MNHVPVNELPYCKPVKKWLIDKYGKGDGLVRMKIVKIVFGG